MIQPSNSIANASTDNFLTDMFQQSTEDRENIAKHSIYLKPTRLSNCLQKSGRSRGHHTSSSLSKGVLIIEDEDEDDSNDDMETVMNRESGTTVGRESFQSQLQANFTCERLEQLCGDL